MSQNEQLSLSWDAHQKSICSGLSVLQQRGEFVDMTLAADGHHVKVHQMVLSLVSPYIKELISSAQCPHPVIFLNNISYTTLCSLLEYVYTGEVHVAKNKLAELILAGKALHIRGLREMDDKQLEDPINESSDNTFTNSSVTEKLKIHSEQKKNSKLKRQNTPPAPIHKVYVDDSNYVDTTMDFEVDKESNKLDNSIMKTTETLNESNSNKSPAINSECIRKTLMNQKVQYSISIHGGLQIIHNRYIYHLRYYSKKNKKRLWRCIDYSSNLKCSANICTDDSNQVTERSYTHNHPFHDSKIIKKLSAGIIYSVIQEAENKADCKKKERRVPCVTVNDDIKDDIQSD